VDSPSSIWILEDDQVLCSLLSERFDALGWRSRAFHRPRSLEQALGEESPSLLVLDEMLPERRGGDLLAGLRQQGHLFPVVMLSAMRTARDRIAGLEAGADDYLGKPFEFRELQLRIERLLGVSQAGNAAQIPPPAQECFQLGSLFFDVPHNEIESADGTITRISRGDAAMLQALCRRPREVIGRQTLARMSGSLVNVSQSRSIDVRLGRLRRLLKELLPEEQDLIEAYRGQGYRLMLDAQPAEPRSRKPADGDQPPL
jgi:two-component system phosphate regulon response regulator OmpR